MNVAELGGMFSLMVLAHFVFDWLPQPEGWALVKHKDHVIRFIHCFVYSILMTIQFWIITGDNDTFAAIFSVLFISHFIEDTYWFPMWWLKNVRKAKGPAFEGLNLILLIVVDQLVHIVTVLVACIIALH
jgi:hypothetical protein